MCVKHDIYVGVEVEGCEVIKHRFEKVVAAVLMYKTLQLRSKLLRNQ